MTKTLLINKGDKIQNKITGEIFPFIEFGRSTRFVDIQDILWVDVGQAKIAWQVDNCEVYQSKS